MFPVAGAARPHALLRWTEPKSHQRFPLKKNGVNLADFPPPQLLRPLGSPSLDCLPAKRQSPAQAGLFLSVQGWGLWLRGRQHLLLFDVSQFLLLW